MADIKFKLEVEQGNFGQAIDRAIGDINRLGREMGATQSEIKKAYSDLGKQSFAIGGNDAVVYFQNQVKEAAKVVADLEAEMQKVGTEEGFDKGSKEAKELEGNLSIAKKELESLKAAYDGAEGEQLAQASQNAKGLGEAMNSLPGPIGGAVRGLKKLLTAAKAFIATPLGAVIAALAAALGVLKSYFSGSADGQAKMAKSSAYLGSILSSLKDVAIAIGRALSNAFDNPIESIKNLWKAIQKNLMTRLEGVVQQVKALGKMLKSLFSADWDGLKEGAKEYADSMAKIGTGKSLEDLKDGLNSAKDTMTAFAKKAKETADAMAALATREYNLRQQRSKWQIKEADLDNKIAQARMKANDEDATKAEQAKALADAQELIRQKYEQQIAFAKEEYEITKAKNSLHESTIEDKEKENDLQAEIVRLQAQMASEMASVDRRRASASKAAREQEFNLLQEAKQLEIQIGEERLKMQDESLNKTLEQIELDRRRRQIELDTQKHQWEAAQGGELTQAQKDYIQSMSGLIEEAAATAGETAIFEKYADAAEKAIKKNAAFENDINTLIDNGIDITEAERQRDNASLEYMQDIEGGLTPEFKAWIDSLATFTTNTLEEMLSNAEAEAMALRAKGASDADIMAAQARVAALRNEVKQAQTDIQRGPKLTAYKNLNKVLGDAASGFEALGQTGNEAFDSLMKEIADITSTVQSVIANIQTLVSASIEGMKQGADEGAKAVKAVEKASVILAIIGAVLSLAIKVSNALGGEHDNLRAIQSEVNDLRNALRDLKREMALDVSGNKSIFGENQLKNLEQYTKATQDYAAEYQKAVEKMSTAWIYTNAERETGRAATMSAKERESRKKLGEAMLDAGYIQPAKDLQSAIGQMLDSTMIKTQHKTWFRKEQSDSLRNLLGDVQLLGETEEETMANLKKFTESDLFGRLSDEQQEAINNMIADWDTYKEALQGIKDYYSSFFNGMSDAFAESIKIGIKDGAAAGKENFKEAVLDMVTDMYISKTIGESFSKTLSDATTKIMDIQKNSSLSAGQKDSKITDIVTDTANDLSDGFDESLSVVSAIRDKVKEKLGIGGGVNDGTLSGAIKGASQESIDLLSGYCNAVRIQQVDGINIMREQLISLSGIEGNTRAINVGLQGFRTSMENILRTDGARAVGAN